MGASAVLHGLVLAVLGWTVAPRLPTPPEPPSPPAVRLELVREPPPTRKLQPSSQAPATVANPPKAAAREPRPQVTPTPTPTVPSASKPAGQAAGTSAATGAPHAGPMPAGEPGADLRGFLRATMGCSHKDDLHLTDAEHTRCDRGFGLAARTAPHLDAIPPEKRAYYDAVAEAYRSARDATFVPPDHIGKGPKGLDVGGGVHPKCFGMRPPNAIHIPGTSCWIVPQRGVLTEELGLPAPPPAQ